MLRWARYLRAGVKAAEPPALTLARARMQQEHSQLGRRLLRLLRRATARDAAAQQQGSGELAAMQPDQAHDPHLADGISVGAKAAQPAPPPVIEAEMQHLELMPCGGAILVHITLPRGELTPALGTGADHLQWDGEEGQPSGWEGTPGDDVDTLPAAAAIVGRVMGGRGVVLDCSVRTAPVDVAALTGVSWPSQLRAQLQRCRPAPHDEGCFFWVEELRQCRLPESSPEPSPVGKGNESGGSVNGGGAFADGLCTAVLHARKLPQLLVLCMQHSGAMGAGGEEGIAAVATRMAALCGQMNAAVVAIDVRCHNGTCCKECNDSGGGAGLTSAWLLYVTGLQAMDHGELHAAVLHHLGGSDGAAPARCHHH